MFDKLESIKEKYENLKKELYSPEVSADIQKSIKLSKEINKIEEVYELYISWKQADNAVKESKEIIENEDDDEMIEMAKEQYKEGEIEKEALEKKLKIALIPKDENDDKNIYMEIRPAAGGDEASLFAEEMMRMYINYAEMKGWKVTIEDVSEKDGGGISFAMLKVVGNKVYSQLKYESGVHRVQRIPETENKGRIHTSTVTIAVLPEIDEIVDYEIDMKDIEMQFMAASSAGGQHANRNKTGCRVHHIPTGIIVVIADSKSQSHNKEKAFNILRSRLLQAEQDKQATEERNKKLYQIGTGDRSEKIRTYNFPQDRITDHRIKKSYSNIPAIMNGEIGSIINDLIVEEQSMLMHENI